MYRIYFKAKPLAIILSSIICFAATVFTASAFAAPDSQTESLKNQLQKEMGEHVQVKTVEKSVLPGIYQVVIENEVIYADATGRYIFSGNLFDTKERESLTEKLRNQVNKIDFAKLPIERAMITKRGTGKQKLVVFSDPRCQFCQQYEAELKKLEDVTIYTYIYPILGEQSEQLAKKIWCSPNRNKAWEDWMFSKKEPTQSKKSCDDAVLQKNIAWGKEIYIQGTPTTILPSGRRFSGVIDADRLNAALKEESK